MIGVWETFVLWVWIIQIGSFSSFTGPALQYIYIQEDRNSRNTLEL